MAAVIHFYPKQDIIGDGKIKEVKDITSTDEKFTPLDSQGLPGFVKVNGKRSGSSKERTFAIRTGDIDSIEYVAVA